MRKLTSRFGSLLCLFALLPALSAQPATPSATNTPAAVVAPNVKVDASAALEKNDPKGSFLKKHESFLARGKAGPIGVLFLGDSITDNWTRAPHIWETYYGAYQPANFGIGGDQTQHVIWRIEHGELDGIQPKVVVLMLGTNNTGTHSASEIAAADKKIIEMIRAKIPETKVLLLAIFPRGARRDADGKLSEKSIVDANKRMAIIAAANQELAALDDGKNVRFLDIGAQFLGQDGNIPYTIMPDQLHPTAAGYQLWADAMKPLLTEMLK